MTPTQKAVLRLIYHKPEDFIRWPERSLLLLPGAVREDYHRYPDEVLRRLREKRIAADGRSNGPAICSFLLAGGERPMRYSKTAKGNERGWNIHHIYDGKFPYSGEMKTTHAVKDGRYFTEAAGLVAIHPLADAAADEFAEFAWWLRAQAFKRFGFDPDSVFENL